MSNTIIVDALAQLAPYLNDKNVLELVVRGKNQRISAFQKVALNDLQQGEGKALMEKVIQGLNQNTGNSEKTNALLRNVVQSQNLGLVLNGLNLCATCVGFAIMYEKLDKMGTEINQQIGKLQSIVKQGTDIQATYEFNKVLADHTDMLDCRKKQQPYDEKQLRKLVDREYNVLMLLIDVLKYDVADNRKIIIETAVSLLAMMTVSLCYFDEVYYFNNKEVLAEKDPWHSSHEKWMGAYSKMREKWFVELLQDHGSFETNLNTLGVDLYYTAILDQVSESKQKVEDNQMLIVTIGDIGVLHTLQEQLQIDIENTLSDAINDAFKDAEDLDTLFVRDRALKQAAFA